MALLHNMSEECLKTELDLFTVPLTQTAIEKNTYIEVPPLSAISDSSPLEFFIAGTGEDYVDLNNTLVFLLLKITNADGVDIENGAPVGLINYAGATVFSQVDVSLGDHLISQSSSTHPYRCIIECLTNYGKDALETLFSAGLFYKDTAGHMDVADPAGGNRSLTKRVAFTNGSNVVELLAPVHSDIFFQEKLMLNGVDIKIRMTRGKDEFCLMRSDAVAYKLNILSASLFVKKVSVSPAVRLGHAQELISTTAKYLIDRVCLKNFSIPAGSCVCNQENVFLGTLPKSVVLAMTDNDTFTGSYNKNPFAFKNYDLEFLAIYLDGQQHPAKPLQPEYESGSAVREFYQLALTSGNHLKNQALIY
ncbi:uncharacterized protein F54H12.2-like [Myxocyprinus asiaticus]|uniref:uncharacterized protein F54H12.2-like n=1 Tax=Myxocyprinus asiaticus TaxID=70543 RepID=UPI002221375A|nr:uncharacterized protein F54H12.2-like [Myxocyprinus asiaticus]